VLFNLAGNVLRGEHALAALLDRLRETFGQEAVTLLEHRPGTPLTPARQRDPGSWQVIATVGGQPCTSPDEGDTDIPVGEDLALVLRGRSLPAADRRILEAFAAQAAAALRQQRLAEEAERTRPIAEADKMRTALLSAVSHDLRTPLSSARAAVDSLASPSIRWSDEERGELVATAKDSLERLDRLVANLLDMSRLQAGALGIHPQSLTVEEIIPRVLDDLGDAAGRVQANIPESLPEAVADPALLERILVNLAANAVRYSPDSDKVLLTANALGDKIELRVADRGPCIPPADRDRVFQPFQRLGDRDNHTGVGLGLALARGLTEAMNGTLIPDDTPGGGLTMILTLPAAATPAAREASPDGAATGDQTAHPAITERIDTWRASSPRGAAP
jgi:two-component system sensor histidine kinase KdpD